jgi:hypothetical protein
MQFRGPVIVLIIIHSLSFTVSAIKFMGKCGSMFRAVILVLATVESIVSTIFPPDVQTQPEL